MKRIGLTQRVEVIEAYGERRDCLDQAWNELLIKLGLMPVALPNITSQSAISSLLQASQLDGVILTGGNDLPETGSAKVAPERDLFEVALIDHCLERHVPIVGVCRGMQVLNSYFSGSLIKVANHVTKNHRINMADGSSYQVNSYHDWGISDQTLAAALQAKGWSEDGLVELCEHPTLAIKAMMWHPERPNVDTHLGTNIIKEAFQ